MEQLYQIRRFFQQGRAKVIKTGLTLDEAQAHCKDPETSSRTCATAAGKSLTARRGQWFDGYEKDPN